MDKETAHRLAKLAPIDTAWWVAFCIFDGVPSWEQWHTYTLQILGSEYPDAIRRHPGQSLTIVEAWRSATIAFGHAPNAEEWYFRTLAVLGLSEAQLNPRVPS